MIQIKKIELNKDKILKQLAKLSELIESDKWKLEYDAELDELFFGIDTMPNNSILFNINDELNLFVTPDSKVNGIFVEYFANNYIEHNKILKPVLKVFKKTTKKSKVDQKLAKEALENRLLNQAMGSVVTMKKIFVAVI